MYGTALQPPPSPPAMGMVPRIGCTTSLESNYHARYLCFPAPPLWGGLGVVCMYLRRLVGIGMYVCMYVMYVCMYVCTHVCMYVCMYARMYVCMYARMYVCLYVCMGMVPGDGCLGGIPLGGGCRPPGPYIYIYIHIGSNPQKDRTTY